MAKEGKDTTEYQALKQVDWLSKMALGVGGLLTVLPALIENFPVDSKMAVWGGVALAGLSVAAKILSALGYTVSRTRVKEAEAATRLGNPPDAG